MSKRQTVNIFTPGRGYERDDWDIVSDNPELSVEEMAAARPFADVFPELASSIRRVRGAQKAPTKVRLTLRLDRETVDAFKATGQGWQVRIGNALKNAIPR